MTSWLLALLAVSGPFLDQIPNPRPSGSWVSDGAQMLSDDMRNAIDQRISGLERDLGVEMAVVTIEDVGDENPKEVATALFNHWGIGKRGRDNGLLLLLAKKQRRLEIETGYGLEAVLPDSWLGLMQTQAMVPLFKQGDFGQGVDVGVQRIEARLRERSADLAGESGTPSENRGGSSVFGLVVIILLFCGAVGARPVIEVVRRYRRRCPSCKVAMLALDQEHKNQLLSEGQRAEERLSSVHHEVYQCAHCHAVRVLSHGTWFSRFQSCNSCGFKTSRVDKTIVEAPTIFSTGLEETVEDCANCGAHTKSTRVLPIIDRSTSSSSSSSSDSGWSSSSGSSGSSSGSSSSSSGGGSFGGGSSGGGGAGSSW